MAVLNEDVNQVERFLNTGANELIQVVVGSLMVGVFFFAMTASLAALALLPVPLILIGAFWFQRRLQPRYAAAREAAATVSARLDNNLAGMATIQAYTAEDAELAHVRAASDAYRHANAEAIRFAAAITPVIRMAVLAGFAVTLLYGGWLVLQGQLGAGSYAALVYLTQRLLWPLTRLAEMTDLYNRSMASVQRVMDLLDSRVPAPPPGRIETRPRGALAFEHVRHAYQGQVALDDVSFHVGPGQTVALVGATGAGKSTLLKRLLGFLDAQRGRITLDGRDLAEVDPRSLRRQLAYVAQEPFLTDGSVAENIAYGDPAPDAARIEAAARAAAAHDFIAALPGGYGAQVGERGARLSGVSASASPWPARSTAIRRCWCWTKPRRPSTTKPKPRSNDRSPRMRRAGVRSWSRTASAPCVMPTPSTCWSMAASSSPARTSPCWPATGRTLHSGACRPATPDPPAENAMPDLEPSTAPSTDDPLDRELRAAVSAGDFELHYQPKVRCPDGGFEGFEALVRWRHPTRGLVPPGQFIPRLGELGPRPCSAAG